MALLVVALFIVAGCGSQQTSPSPETTQPASEDTPLTSEDTPPEPTDVDDEDASDSTLESEEMQAEYERALSASALVTGFVGEKFYDKPVEDEDAALAAVQSVIERVGGDETTILELREIRPTETGTTYYTFRQRAGDVLVHGASVKLVVDKDHKVCGLVSALLPDVQLEDLDSWEITADEAEKVVLDESAYHDNVRAKLVKGATEQTAIGLEGDSQKLRYAWVVYTNNYFDDVDAAYLAHYVDADGEYLYSIPVSEPSNADALAGDEAAFPFGELEKATWSGTVTKRDGTKMDIEVPILINPETEEVIMADADRKILCADYASYWYDEQISPRIEGEDGFDNDELIIYDTFIKVWDLFDSIGWTGPDGDGTPSLIGMDMVNEDGEVIQNAAYGGRDSGFQTFSFNRIDPDGECFDIMAHEFTHCVTSTTMTANLYLNDAGAINEGMSDIIGNLTEMMIAYDADGEWLIGENEGEGEGPYRSMKDPHAFYQPERTWDVYYGPAVGEATTANDCGGVHVNSSLLNLISYKLDQAGMPLTDQFYFWMNVALAMTPSTDYPQMAELLPWCMEQAGYAEYVDAVKKAIEDTRIAETEKPDKMPEDCGCVMLSLPEKTPVDKSDMRLVIRPAEGGEDTSAAITWAGGDSNVFMATVPTGNYVFEMICYEGESTIGKWSLGKEGWAEAETEAEDDAQGGVHTVTVASGETVVLPSTGLAA